MTHSSQIRRIVVTAAFALISSAFVNHASAGPATGGNAEGVVPDLAPKVAPGEGVAIEQRLGQKISLDNKFRDQDGREIQLGELFGKRPVVLMLGYYECPMLCNQVLHGLLTTLKGIDFEAGREFDVVVVSISPDETPLMALRKRSAFLAQYKRGDQAGAGVHFLCGDQASITKLADEVGFKYRYDEKIKQYAHAAGVLVVTPAGTTARYFYGIDYSTRDMRFALIDAAEEKIGSAVDQFLMLCFHYDPTTGKYGLAIMRLLRTAGIATVCGIALFVTTMLRRERAGRTP